MTTTAFDDQYLAAPEPVRRPYDTASILHWNVADLEIALRKQTERAEAAEAELLAVREDNHGMMLEIDGLRTELAKRAREHQQEMTSFRLRVRSQDDATFAALREENERLKVDAERYRWLRDAGATFYTGGPEITDGSDKVHVCEFAMDAAIDAAKRHCAILPCSCK